MQSYTKGEGGLCYLGARGIIVTNHILAVHHLPYYIVSGSAALSNTSISHQTPNPSFAATDGVDRQIDNNQIPEDYTDLDAARFSRTRYLPCN